MIRFDVYGEPLAKGSSSAFVNRKTGRAVVSAFGSGKSAQRLRTWEATVRAYARDAVGDRAPPFQGVAVLVVLTFLLARPRSHYGSGKNADKLKPSSPEYPISKPDFDKLARSTSDAMTGIVWDDDSRVVEALVRKRYAPRGQDAGATIVVDVMSPSATLEAGHG